MKIRVAHTPDADDAFMFYAMTHGKIETWLEIEHHIEDIEALNKKAFSHEFEVTAISAYAYSKLSDMYQILSSGASVGDGYGLLLLLRMTSISRERESLFPEDTPPPISY